MVTVVHTYLSGVYGYSKVFECVSISLNKVCGAAGKINTEFSTKFSFAFTCMNTNLSRLYVYVQWNLRSSRESLQLG